MPDDDPPESPARQRTGKAATGKGAPSIAALALVAGLAAACTSGHSASSTSSSAPIGIAPAPGCPVGEVAGGPKGCYVVPAGIHKIKHVIVIMQENRSFDTYFGTFPGADGIPMKDGVPTVCVPNPLTHVCDKPFHDVYDINGGGPHGESAAIGDVGKGKVKMQGFIAAVVHAKQTCNNPQDPACVFVESDGRSGEPDVMGYHTAAEIPNYWTYAKDFVLDDHMFEPVKSWSEVDHMYLVSGWAAHCTSDNPMSCKTDIGSPYGGAAFNAAVAQEMAGESTNIDLAWTDETWLLHMDHVSWGYFVQTGYQPDCSVDNDETCKAVPQSYRSTGIWNPLPLFTDVHEDRQLNNVQPLDNFLIECKKGTLPSVSWITPSGPDSEHPPSSVHQGQAYVTSLINAIMKSPDWSSTAIFLSWDDWGGFYDNVVPPVIDAQGYGLRVPSIVISPYAKKGYIDHETLSSDAYLKFIEDDFLGGARLNPKSDGRPDPRPDVREDVPQLGNLVNDFNFNQTPRPPVLLPTNPPSDSPTLPAYFKGKPPCYGCTVQPPAH